MNAPSMQSVKDTPHTPHAILIPDHGTTPINRNTDNRTHADERPWFDSSSVSDAPSNAFRVMSSARGKKCVRNGASGVANSVAQAEPSIVSVVSNIVAYAGENKAPPKTF